MKKFKKEKGITLVALIITIVVLLILAVVAIGAVQDSKIMAHSQNAAGGYNTSKIYEEDMLKNYTNIINNYVPKEDSKSEEEKIIEILNENNFFSKIQKIGDAGIYKIDSYYKGEVDSKTYYLGVLEVSAEPYYLLITENSIYTMYVEQTTMQITKLGNITDTNINDENFNETKIREDIISIS